MAAKVPQIARLDRERRSCDVLVVGAGAAGLFAGLAARGALEPKGGVASIGPGAPDVVLLNNEARLGLKILVSGGGRCNLTNATVDEGDYLSDTPKVVRSLLRGFPSEAVRAFFQARGLKHYEEPLGKVFPATNKARDVLARLLDAVHESGIDLIAPAEVCQIRPPETAGGEWTATLSDRSAWRAKRLILATGGKSLPKTGSRGFGLQALAELGHTIPAVLTLAPASVSPEQLSGSKFKPLARAAGSLLVTHRGATGPAPFDVSGPCGSALAQGEAVRLTADFWSLGQPESAWAPFRGLDKSPGAALRPQDAPRPPTREVFEASAAPLLAGRERGIAQALSPRLPRSLLQSLCRAVGLDPTKKVKQLDTRERRDLFLILTQADLGLSGAEGYAKAEVTAGGVRLDELQRKTLESKRHPGLHCCGEVVNVTGRLGGFNFQWAWSSGYAAGRGAAAGLSPSG